MQMWFEGETQDGVTKLVNLSTIACVEPLRAPDTSGYMLWFVGADYGIKMKGSYDDFKANLMKCLESQ